MKGQLARGLRCARAAAGGGVAGGAYATTVHDALPQLFSGQCLARQEQLEGVGKGLRRYRVVRAGMSFPGI